MLYYNKVIYTSKKSYNFVDDGQHVEVVSLPQRLIQIQVLSKELNKEQGTNKVNKPKTTTTTKNLCKKTREFVKDNDF